MTTTTSPLPRLLNGVGHELKFWKHFVQTDRFLHGWVAPVRTPELQQPVYDFISSHLTPQSQVLDAGSGVVSLLRGTVPSPQLTATDPLGELYECVFDYARHGITPPLPYGAEDLSALPTQYDIVHISNALDHTQYPVQAYYELLRVCRPGGYLVVQGFENEAEYERWCGFHQWNIRLNTAGHLEIAGRDGVVMTATQCVQQQRITLPNGKTWFIWIVQA